jgi:hypothetical protein
VTGKRFTRLSKIFASALLGAGLLATCAAASPGSSAAAATTSTASTAAAAATGVTLTNPGDQVAKVLPETVSLQLSATDSAGGTLTYTATGLPPGTSIDASTGLISGTVTDYYDGTASVTATDSGGASATASFTWLAENAIYVASVSTIQNRPDSSARLGIEASDPEAGEKLTYGATGLPPGLSINSTTGVISGTTAAATGSYAVSVTASDSTGSSASISFTWRVWNVVNVSYTVATIEVGTAVSVPVTATDSAAGQTFTFSATGLPPGLSINPASGVVSGSTTSEGEFDVTITATDSGGSQGLTTGYWLVRGKAAITSPGNLVTTAGQLAQVSLKVGDTADNARLYYEIAGGPPGAYVNWDDTTADGWKTATLTGWAAPAGTYKTTISLIGNFDPTVSVTFTWTVKPTAGTGPTGPVRLNEDGLCLDDTNNSSANGNKVQLWSCNEDTAQNWTYAEDGTLRIHGKCLDDTGYGTKAGTKCCPSLKMPILAAFTMPMENPAIRAVAWARCRRRRHGAGSGARCGGRDGGHRRRCPSAGVREPGMAPGAQPSGDRLSSRPRVRTVTRAHGLVSCSPNRAPMANAAAPRASSAEASGSVRARAGRAPGSSATTPRTPIARNCPADRRARRIHPRTVPPGTSR